MAITLGVYGAVLSTALGIITIIKFLRERPRISVEAGPVWSAADESAETHGVLVRVQRGSDIVTNEVDVEFCLRNSGGQSLQITDVFVETGSTISQVRPEGLPAILAPNTSHTVRVQPEYFAPRKPNHAGGLEAEDVEAVGVYDALGKKHQISQGNLSELLRTCNELPLRIGRYRHKTTGAIISAFQIKDKATLVRKGPNAGHRAMASGRR